MYEPTVEELEMKQVFGKDVNVLIRNGLKTVKDVKDYFTKYPFDEYKKYHALYYINIGPARYKRILESYIRNT